MNQQHAGTVNVQRMYGKETEEVVETLEVRTFATTPARVKCGLSATLNLGNYESARIEVSIELPAYVEEVEAAYTAASNFCVDKIRAEVAQVRAKQSENKRTKERAKNGSTQEANV